MADKEKHFADMALNYGMMLADTRIALRNLVAAAQNECSNCFYQPEVDVARCDNVACSHYDLRVAVAAAKEVLK